MSTDDTTNELPAHIACLFFGFTPNDYWKKAIAEQHPEALKASEALLAAQKQRWAIQMLDRLTIQATETKDVKTGAIRQTVGLGYILNERRRLEDGSGEAK